MSDGANGNVVLVGVTASGVRVAIQVDSSGVLQLTN